MPFAIMRGGGGGGEGVASRQFEASRSQQFFFTHGVGFEKNSLCYRGLEYPSWLKFLCFRSFLYSVKDVQIETNKQKVCELMK